MKAFTGRGVTFGLQRDGHDELVVPCLGKSDDRNGDHGDNEGTRSSITFGRRDGCVRSDVTSRRTTRGAGGPEANVKLRAASCPRAESSKRTDCVSPCVAARNRLSA